MEEGMTSILLVDEKGQEQISDEIAQLQDDELWTILSFNLNTLAFEPRPIFGKA